MFERGFSFSKSRSALLPTSIEPSSCERPKAVALSSVAARKIKESGAEVVVANDCGCLMQIGGGLSRAGAKIETRHLAEVLASR